MNLRFLLILLLTGGGLYQNALAQSSWIGNMPMQFNPSFAGSSDVQRLSMALPYKTYFREQQDDQLKSNTIGGSISYDNFIRQLGSGIGFSLFYTNLHKLNTYEGILPGHGSYRSENDSRTSKLYTAFTVSPKINIRGKYTLAPSIQLNYFNSIIILYQNSSSNYGVYEGSFKEYLSRFSLSSGLLFNTKKFYLGYSIHFKSLGYRLRDSLYSSEFDLWIKHGLQAGYTFQRNSESDFSFTTQLAVNYVNGWRPVSKDKELEVVPLLNISFRYKKFIWGLSTTGIMAGYQNKKIRIAYVHELFGKDSPINKGPSISTYKAELSFKILIPKKHIMSYVNP